MKNEDSKPKVVTLSQFNLLKAEFDSFISQVKDLKRKVSELEEEVQLQDEDMNTHGAVLDQHDEAITKLKRFKKSQKLNIPKVLEEPPVVLEEPELNQRVYEQAEPTPKVYETPTTPPYTPLDDY